MTECKQEFEKIFKQKSGNEWGNKDNFVPINKKYKLVKINYRTVDRKDYLIPFDELKDEQIPKSNLPERVQEFMKLITTAKGY